MASAASPPLTELLTRLAAGGREARQRVQLLTAALQESRASARLLGDAALELLEAAETASQLADHPGSASKTPSTGARHDPDWLPWDLPELPQLIALRLPHDASPYASPTWSIRTLRVGGHKPHTTADADGISSQADSRSWLGWTGADAAAAPPGDEPVLWLNCQWNALDKGLAIKDGMLASDGITICCGWLSMELAGADGAMAPVWCELRLQTAINQTDAPPVFQSVLTRQSSRAATASQETRAVIDASPYLNRSAPNQTPCTIEFVCIAAVDDRLSVEEERAILTVLAPTAVHASNWFKCLSLAAQLCVTNPSCSSEKCDPGLLLKPPVAASHASAAMVGATRRATSTAQQTTTPMARIRRLFGEQTSFKHTYKLALASQSAPCGSVSTDEQLRRDFQRDRILLYQWSTSSEHPTVVNESARLFIGAASSLSSVTSSLARSIRRASAQLAMVASGHDTELDDDAERATRDEVLPSLSASVALGAARDALRASNRTSLTGDLFTALHNVMVPVGSSLSLSPLDTEAEPLIVGCGPWALDMPSVSVSPATQTAATASTAAAAATASASTAAATASASTLRIGVDDISKSLAADPLGLHQPSPSTPASTAAESAVQGKEWNMNTALPVILIACSCTVGFRLVDTDATATSRGFATLAVIMCRAVRWLIVDPLSGHVTPMLGQLADVTACCCDGKAASSSAPDTEFNNPLSAIRAARKLWNLALPEAAAADDLPNSADETAIVSSSLNIQAAVCSSASGDGQAAIRSSASGDGQAAIRSSASGDGQAAVRVTYGAWKLPPARVTVSLPAPTSTEHVAVSPQPQPRRLAPFPAARPNRHQEDRISVTERAQGSVSPDAVEPARVVVRLSGAVVRTVGTD